MLGDISASQRPLSWERAAMVNRIQNKPNFPWDSERILMQIVLLLLMQIILSECGLQQLSYAIDASSVIKVRLFPARSVEYTVCHSFRKTVSKLWHDIVRTDTAVEFRSAQFKSERF